MELSKKQLEIVTSKEDRILVDASAACGKTAVLTERIRYLIRSGVDPHDICAITFTNLSAAEMKNRLAEDDLDGLTISTIHGLAAKFLASHGINIQPIINSQKFDDFFSLIKKYPQCIQHIKYILVDEFQDVSNEEYEFIFDMIEPDSYFLIGDEKQCIYEGLGANPNLFRGFKRDGETVVYDLNENYRNKSNILNFAKEIMEGDKSIPKNIGGEVYSGIYTVDFIANKIKEENDYKNWSILCYTNAEVEQMQDKLYDYDIPTITFKQGGLTKKELDNMVNSNKVKVLTCWAAKGLEFPKVVVCGKNWVHGAQRKRIEYVAATRAMDMLIWFKSESKKKRKAYW